MRIHKGNSYIQLHLSREDAVEFLQKLKNINHEAVTLTNNSITIVFTILQKGTIFSKCDFNKNHFMLSQNHFEVVKKYLTEYGEIGIAECEHIDIEFDQKKLVYDVGIFAEHYKSYPIEFIIKNFDK